MRVRWRERSASRGRSGASNQLVYTIQGRSSRWQDSIIINRGGASDANDRLDPKEAAQVRRGRSIGQNRPSFFEN